MLTLPALPRRARDDHGFTLIETLVAMVTGVIVTGALFAILEVSMHQSSRLSDVAQATQLGRTTMNHIVDEMHSACLAAGFTPVVEGSNKNEVIFENAYSEKAEIPSAATMTSGARKDKIVWSEASQTLTDNVYLSTGGAWPQFTYSGTATPIRIGEKITQAEGENSKKAKEKYIFKYYEYATASSTTPTAPSSTLTEMTVEPGKSLSAKEAEKVAAVMVGFKTAPNNGKTELGRGVELSSLVTFGLSAPSSETPVAAAPCE